MELVSIIIPTYNVEDYIEECLYSIINQSYTPYEVIIIDDGSVDRTVELVNRFQSVHNITNIKIIKQENSGQSIARNKGIREARGKYIIFMDSDDWFASNEAISKMVTRIEHEKADYIQCSFQFVRDSNYFTNHVKQKKTIDGQQALLDTLQVNNLYTSPWAKIYSTKFLKNNNLFFIEGLVNEDTGFSISIAAKSTKVGFLQDIVYCSRERKGSTSRTSFIRMFDTMHQILDRTRQELISLNVYDSIQDKFEARYLRSMIYNLMQTAQRSNYKTYIQDRKYCFNHTDYILKNRYKTYLPFKHRVLIYMSNFKTTFYLIAKILKVAGFKMH